MTTIQDILHAFAPAYLQANPHGAPSFTYLAPYVCKVASSHRRIVSLQERTVTFSSRQPGRSRQRITQLDAMECIRRFLPHGLPDGFMTVRHVGLMNSPCDIPPETLQRMILKRQPRSFEMPDIEAPQPVVAAWPTCGKPMPLVRRLWTSTRVLLDTG